MCPMPAAASPQGRGLTAPGRPLASMRYRDFRVLMAGTMALNIGSWVQTIGLGWLVLNDLDGSATDLGLVALLRGASLIVVSPLTGYAAGRFERRRLLLVFTFASAGIASLIAGLIMADAMALWMIYCTSVGAGVTEAFAGPIRNLLVFDAVGRDDLTNATALNALGANSMRVVGPALGGVLIGTVGTEGAFQVQAACLLVSAVFTFRLRPGSADGVPAENIFRNLAGGLRYIWTDRAMLTIVTMAFLPSVLVYPYVSFLPVFARDELGSDQTGYGYLAAAVGLGSVAGGWVVATTTGGSRGGTRMASACVLYAAAVGGFALARDLWLAVAILVVAGAFHSVYSALNASLMQLRAAPEYRSRVIALQTIMWGTTPFAALLWGWMIDAWSGPPVVAGWTLAAGFLIVIIQIRSKELRRL